MEHSEKVVPHVDDQEKRTLAELKSALYVLLGDRLVRLALFGSKARGDESEESDLDIAIVVKGMDRELKRKILDIVTDIESRNLAVLSTFIISSEEFDQLRQRERRIALDIEKDGVPLMSYAKVDCTEMQSRAYIICCITLCALSSSLKDSSQRLMKVLFDYWV